MQLVTHYRPAATSYEQWVTSHYRRLHVHTFHHHTLHVCDDGRIALATGPYVNLLIPPQVPNFRPSLNPQFRVIYSADTDQKSVRKDTLSTNSHLTAIVWAQYALILLDGCNSVSRLRPALLDRDATHGNLSYRSNTFLWKKSPLFLSASNSSNPDAGQTDVRSVAFARVSRMREHTLHFHPYLVCGTSSATDLFSLDAEPSIFASIPVAFRLHPVCTISLACADGVAMPGGVSATVVAVADARRDIVVYAVSLRAAEADGCDRAELHAQRVWTAGTSIPPGPAISLSWCLDSARDAAATLSAAIGNDVVVVDWGARDGEALSDDLWELPRVQCVRDAHEHIVTAVQVCCDGSVVSGGMDGRIVCWRIGVPGFAGCDFDLNGLVKGSVMPVVAVVLQDRAESNEPVMALQRTENGFGLVALTSTSRQSQEVCDTEVMRKYTGNARRTSLRMLVVPPYGTAEEVEGMVMHRVMRLMNHANGAERPLTLWDASFFLHSYSEVSASVAPLLFERLRDMVDELERDDEEVEQRFVQKTRSLLWLSRVINHPDCVAANMHEELNMISKRLRHALLFVRYVENLRRFDRLNDAEKKGTKRERQALEAMCQYVACSAVSGWQGVESGIEVVRHVRSWLEPFVAAGEVLTSTCSVCVAEEGEGPVVADAEDAGNMWCLSGHTFARCVVTGLPVMEAVGNECGGCGARGATVEEGAFRWVRSLSVCSICCGGLTGGHCDT